VVCFFTVDGGGGKGYCWQERKEGDYTICTHPCTTLPPNTATLHQPTTPASKLKIKRTRTVHIPEEGDGRPEARVVVQHVVEAAVLLLVGWLVRCGGSMEV
jgi:hypothetical protein